MQLYTKDPSDYKNEPIFMGKNRNVQRYDIQKYPFFNERAKVMRGLFWSPEEVNMSKDRTDYQTLSPGLQHVFVSNLKYQTLLDSVMGRSLMMTVGRVVTNPEFEECLAWWDTFEVLHSRSYSHIIQGIFDNPSPVFDDILVNEFIIKRSQTCIRYYDELEEATNEYAVRRNTNPMVGEDLDFLKERILLALVNVNILEGIRFYVSFACSFAFGENKLMVGNASIIKLIATDECQHLILSQYLLKILQSNENEGFVELWNRNIETIREMYRVAFEEEKEWASYLFKDEAILGLNEPILVEYLKHILYQRMAAIDLEPIVEEIKENPIPWIDNWLHYGNVETLPQETENIAYTIGTLKSEIKIDDLEFL